MSRQFELDDYDRNQHRDWLVWCRERLSRYPAVLPRQRTFNGRLNPYHFMEVLFQHLAEDDVIVTGNATACIVAFQTAQIKKGQRLFSNSGAASMGYDPPAAVGAAVARGGKRVICLAGDGSIQLNIQELQTIIHHQLPVKVFVLNNNGYLSIRTSQLNFFDRLLGESPASGVSFPDMVKLAEAYGILARRIERPDFGLQIDEILNMPGPYLAEVMLDPGQSFEPKLSSRQLPDGRIVSASLEDMYPFLDLEELQGNLLIPPTGVTG